MKKQSNPNPPKGMIRPPPPPAPPPLKNNCVYICREIKTFKIGDEVLAEFSDKAKMKGEIKIIELDNAYVKILGNNSYWFPFEALTLISRIKYA